MSDVIWLKPKGAALAAYEDYREKWIASQQAKADYAIARGATGFASHIDGELYALIFDKAPENVPVGYQHHKRSRHGNHVYKLRSPRLKKDRDAIMAEHAQVAALASPPDADRVARSLGLPLSYRYESTSGDGSRGWGRVSNGFWTAWNPTWETIDGSIFIKGCDISAIRKEHPDATVTFDTGEGNLPEDLFELVPYHRVVYILGEEKMAIEEAAQKAPA